MQFIQILEQKGEQKRKQTRIENQNPIKPIKKIMKLATKLNDEIKEIQDMSMDKVLLKNKSLLKINECITLEVIKRGHNTGTVKKMLHVPTLQLICVRQQPLNSKESWNTIRDWTSIWQNKLMSLEDSPFIIIHNAYFNYPQGAVSILMEYFRSRSLLNLLDLTVTLPESVIRHMSIELLSHLKLFYQCTQLQFGGLSPSQIMFTENFKMKLAMGLFYHIPNLETQSIYDLRGVSGKTGKFDFNSTHSKFMKTSIEKPVNLEVERSLDIFKFGLIMLHAAIGSFENFQQSSLIHENLRYIFSEGGQKQLERENVCCLLHSQHYILTMYNPLANTSEGTDRTLRRGESDRFINYLRLLKDRFSLHFINFLCRCLSLSHEKRIKIHELFECGFISSPHDNQNRTVKIELSDLLSLGRGFNQDNIFQSGSHQKLESFLNHMLPVLYGCSREVLTELLTNSKPLMYTLGKEVGLHAETLGKKLEEAINEIIRNR